jgi:crotonobetainyl-CoA:carnitine CoA-transferase CaiB-like acyl-CoA transferase
MQGHPIKFSDTPSKVYRGAPTLGEHNNEVLSGLGFSEEEIALMKEEGAI